jgi:hypothetical protein
VTDSRAKCNTQGKTDDRESAQHVSQPRRTASRPQRKLLTDSILFGVVCTLTLVEQTSRLRMLGKLPNPNPFSVTNMPEAIRDKFEYAQESKVVVNMQ